MDNDIEKIFTEQAKVLPREVREFIASTDWDGELDAIVEHFQLSPDNASTLRTETTLVLAGLTHPDTFRGALAGEIEGVDSTTIDAIVADVAMNVFAPVRTALIRFFAEQEEAEEVESGKLKVESGTKTEESLIVPTPLPMSSPTRSLERMPDVVPDNLPTGELAPEIQSQALESEALKPGFGFLPPLNPKMRPSDDVSEGEPAHPFEEKMKKVFTGGTADMGELAISPTPPLPPLPPRSINDPYREPVE